MEYSNIYNIIVSRAKSRGLDKSKINYYTEKHHIVPKCIFGTNDVTNLVLLTGREHFICHKLLTRIYPYNKHLKFALFMIGTSKDIRRTGRLISSREYEKLRIICNEAKRGKRSKHVLFRPPAFIKSLKNKESLKLYTKEQITNHLKTMHLVFKNTDSRFIPEEDLQVFLNNGYRIIDKNIRSLGKSVTYVTLS